MQEKIGELGFHAETTPEGKKEYKLKISYYKKNQKDIDAAKK